MGKLTLSQVNDDVVHLDINISSSTYVYTSSMVVYNAMAAI